MKIHHPQTAGLCVLLSLAGLFPLHAQTLTQTYPLQNGWNAISLDVYPTDTAPAAVFANLPVASVWTRGESVSSAQFIQNPAETSFAESDWLRWIPGQPSFVSTLRAIQGRRAYLIKLTNGPVNWQVTGQPVTRPIAWTPNQYNLRSFPIDPTSPPTFKQFFGSAAAHYDPGTDRPRSIYRLQSDGQWVLANRSEVMTAGVAYWVYCQGDSRFTAPLALRLNPGPTLDFGPTRERINLELENLAPGTRTVVLRQLGGFVSGLLAYQRFHPTNGFEWVDLPNPHTLLVTNGSPRRLDLAIRRSRLAGPQHTSIMEIADAQGTRHRLPMTAERSGSGYAGLWVGSVTVNAVSEPHFGSLTTNLYALVAGQPTPLHDPGLLVTTNLMVTTNASLVVVTNQLLAAQTLTGTAVPVYEKVERHVAAQTPTPTKSEFTMRLLLHVDSTGTTRLLKEVVEMWRDGTATNNAQGYQVVDQPGTYVLVTRDDLLSQFKGATLRAGGSVGRRLSAIGFDFDGKGTNHLQLAGTFGPGGILTNTLQIPADFPGNPFRHKYHPDHDNLAADFATFKAEAYAVTRQLRFEFATSATGNAAIPDPGYSVMEGNYRETLIGLHKQPLHVQGNFRLSRASFIAELNPSPTP
jgi:hypothetical protein